MNHERCVFALIGQVTIVVFQNLALCCRIMRVIQAIPVSEEVARLQPERNILLILWWVFQSLLKSLLPTFSVRSACCCFSAQTSVTKTHRYILQSSRRLPLPVVWRPLSLRFSVLITVFIFVSFNSSYQPHLGYLQAGRRRGTVKEDATLSTTTVELRHGHDPSFRYTAGFLLYTDTLTLIFYLLILQIKLK